MTNVLKLLQEFLVLIIQSDRNAVEALGNVQVARASAVSAISAFRNLKAHTFHPFRINII